MSEELRLPCRESDTPDDWFIDRTGKQYPSDPLITHDQAIAYLDEAYPDWHDMPVEEVDRIIDRLEADVKTEALARRRNARAACHTDCLFRTRCLDMALREGHRHGTWGGYYEEEIREIRREIERRKKRRGQAPSSD